MSTRRFMIKELNEKLNRLQEIDNEDNLSDLTKLKNNIIWEFKSKGVSEAKYIDAVGYVYNRLVEFSEKNNNIITLEITNKSEHIISIRISVTNIPISYVNYHFDANQLLDVKLEASGIVTQMFALYSYVHNMATN